MLKVKHPIIIVFLYSFRYIQHLIDKQFNKSEYQSDLADALFTAKTFDLLLPGCYFRPFM